MQSKGMAETTATTRNNCGLRTVPRERAEVVTACDEHLVVGQQRRRVECAHVGEAARRGPNPTRRIVSLSRSSAMALIIQREISFDLSVDSTNFSLASQAFTLSTPHKMGPIRARECPRDSSLGFIADEQIATRKVEQRIY
jgi:hypothetical protein